MDYYEELGIDRTATEEEIRRAHRRLTKLLHPDQQTDEAVKQLAETQMRRVNSIVEVLCDPERRREYDRGPKDGFTAFQTVRAKRGAFHSWPWWVGSTVGAIVLTVGAVWFWADKWGSSFGDRNPTYIASGAETGEPNRATGRTDPPQPQAQAPLAADATQSGTQKTPAAPPAATPPPQPRPRPDIKPAPSRTVASVPAVSVGKSGTRNTQIAQTQKQPQESKGTPITTEIPRRKTLKLPLIEVAARPTPPRMEIPAAPALSNSEPGRVETASIPSASLPSMPKLPEPVTPKNLNVVGSPVKTTRDPLEGEWVYAPSEPEKRKTGFYPPEFIDLKIWNESGLRGEYRARYHVADKPIPPDVNFALAPDGNPRHFTWASGNGSKGTLKISSMDTTSIRIEWKTTVFGHAPALTAGTATLVRRTP